MDDNSEILGLVTVILASAFTGIGQWLFNRGDDYEAKKEKAIGKSRRQKETEQQAGSSVIIASTQEKLSDIAGDLSGVTADLVHLSVSNVKDLKAQGKQIDSLKEQLDLMQKQVDELTASGKVKDAKIAELTELTVSQAVTMSNQDGRIESQELRIRQLERILQENGIDFPKHYPKVNESKEG